MNYQGAIFDVDGVLVDSPHEAAWREALRRLMEGEWRELAAQTSYTPSAFSTTFYLAHLAGKPRMAGAAAALAQFGLPDPDGARAALYADQKQTMIVELIEQGAFTAFPDGLRLLLRLKAAGLRLAAASSSKNANAFLVRVPAGPGRTMLDLFDANLCGRDFAQGKPHPAIFLTAAAELGLPPESCFVVEDAVSGVQAARAGGMACIGVARLDDAEQLRAAGATFVVTSLDEVRLEDMDLKFPFTLTPDPRWLLSIEGFDPAREPQIEAVCALVNGYQGTRAAVEEGHPAARPATFIAGVFNTPAAPQAAELEEPIPELVVAPDWSRLRIVAAGSELRLDQVELLEMRRVLDMRQGALLREWRVRDGAGRVTALRSLRFASLADRHALGQILSLSPENYDGEIVLECLIDGNVTNENNTRHLELLEQRATPLRSALAVRTSQSGYTMAMASTARLQGAGAETALEAVDEPGVVGLRWRWKAQAGSTYVMEKIVALASSREDDAPLDSAVARCGALAAANMGRLLATHTAAWAERWAGADAEITGEPAIQSQVRFAIYHLIGAASPDDEHASIGARALTGERYRGHVFWDTEIFAWPPLLYTHPSTARALLMYRYHTLEGARHKAAACGYRGAMYPWEAADSGEEVTPAFMISGGKRVPVLTGVEEHHISADVAFAVLQYVQATGDRAFLIDYGAEMVFDVARFWASRAEPGDGGHYHIRRVIGPDEYHETVDDNAYTNLLAAHILRRARGLAADLAAAAPERWADLTARLQLDNAELERWAAVAEGLAVNQNPQSGLIEQFAGYHQLAEIDLSDHDTSVATVDAKLGWYEMQKTKVLKQADVLMLLILLWEQYAPAAHAANFAYYEPKTSHDSSLSPSFHALFAARLGQLDLAEAYLRRAALIDLDFSRRGHAGATGGVHIAALGGIWQALALGFLGMRPSDEGLRFAPHLPAHWGSLRMAISWRGARLRVHAAADGRVQIDAEQGGPVRVAIADGPWQDVSVGAPYGVQGA